MSVCARLRTGFLSNFGMDLYVVKLWEEVRLGADFWGGTQKSFGRHAKRTL